MRPSTVTDRLAGLELEFGDLQETRMGLESDLSRFENEPVEFAREVLGFEPWSRQEEILRSVLENPLTVARGANATGKDATAFGPVILHHVFVRRGMVIAVAPTERQGIEIGMGELGRWWRAAGLPGQLFRSALRIPGDDSRGVLVFTSNEVSRLTGYHHPRLLVILTECQGLPSFVWEAALSCAIGQEDRILAIGNPLSPEGEFYRACRSPRWHAIKMPASEHPNVVEGRTVIPGGISREGVERLAETYGRESPTFRARVEAEFPSESETSLINLEWLENAADRFKNWKRWATPEGSGGLSVGVDIARSGPDRSVIAVRRGDLIVELIRLPRGDTMETAGRVVLELKRLQTGDCPTRDEWKSGGLWRPGEPPFPAEPGRGRAILDEAGVGGGVVDRIREIVSQDASLYGWDIVDFNSARSPEGEHAPRYINLRAEAYWRLRRLLENGKIGLPRHPELWEELQVTHWKVHSSGRIQIVPKDEIRATLGRSPDYADAVAMALWESGTEPPRIWFESVRL